jgi:hypothetical protein
VTINSKMPVGRFFRDALQYPDGVVAYAIAAFAIFLLVAGWVVLPFLPEVTLLQRAREDWLFLVLVPLAALASYTWLNALLTSTPAMRWRNVAVLLLTAGVFFWRVLFGAS